MFRRKYREIGNLASNAFATRVGAFGHPEQFAGRHGGADAVANAQLQRVDTPPGRAGARAKNHNSGERKANWSLPGFYG